MGIATKSRRKIVAGRKNYLWRVAEGDGLGMVLCVASEDKRFMVQYELRQPKGEEYLVVMGPRFAGNVTGPGWKTISMPTIWRRGCDPGKRLNAD